jgi:hypothetical protein
LQKDTELPGLRDTINSMNSFTPHFLESMDNSGGLGLLVDAAVMESMFNEKPLTSNLFDGIRDHGYTVTEAQQNADTLSTWVETGVFTTSLTRSRYNFTSQRDSPAR